MSSRPETNPTQSSAGKNRPELSVVLPAYNEEGNILPVLQALTGALSPLDMDYEILFVDDGSRDQTWNKILEAATLDNRAKGISLSRNFGHQNAIFAGLQFASGKAVVTMDCDLQHPPTLIPEMVNNWKSGFRIVETRRIDTAKVGLFKRLTSKLFYRVFSKLAGIPITPGSSDFRLLDGEVVEIIRRTRDADLFLRGLTRWVGFRSTTLDFKVGDRFSGKTKFTLRRMIRFAVSSLFSFSTIPLKLGIWVGLATSAVAFVELGYILFVYAQGRTVPGWASLTTVVSFMFGVLFLLVGIIGAYLGSIFDTIKARPKYLVQEVASVGWHTAAEMNSLDPSFVPGADSDPLRPRLG